MEKKLLKNLKFKKIVVKNVITPKQLLGNCWFNAFFMVIFISDKGRKFTRYLRQTMITGKLPLSKTKMEETIHKEFWLLNKSIDASIVEAASKNKWGASLDANKMIVRLGELKNVEK